MRARRSRSASGSLDLNQEQCVPTRVLVSPLLDGCAPFVARGEQLTEEGVFLSTRKVVPVETLLAIEIAFADPALARLRLDAQVVHQVPGAGLGCRFVALSSRDTGRLREAIIHYQSPAEVR